jgi:hypothetical protein
LAEVHPDVATLLGGLLQSPMAPFAEGALQRIQSDNAFRPAPGEDGGQPLEGEALRASVRRQLDHLHDAITVPLKRELELMDRLRGLAETLGLTSIAVLPPPGRFGEATEGPADELLSARRAGAIKAFLEVWGPAANTVRTRWEEGGDGA